MPAAPSCCRSGAAHSARAFWAPYAASKAAVETLARSWADETKNLPLRVNAVDPRATRTAMRAQAMPGENPETLPHPSVIAENILQLASPSLTETGELFDAREENWKPYLGVGLSSCHKSRLRMRSNSAVHVLLRVTCSMHAISCRSVPGGET